MGYSTVTTTSTKAIYEEFQDALRDPKGPDSQGRIWSFCPSHADGVKHQRRSLSLHPRYGLKCFAGCDFGTILAALRGNQPPPIQSFTSEPSVSHEYRDIGNALIAEHGRFDKGNGEKTFLWRLPNGTWKAGLQGKPLASLPLYNSPLLLKRPNETVYLVEGEKAADRCVLEGLLAVTVPQGASGSLPSRDQLAVLSGRKVGLWADNDAPGHELMGRVQSILRGIASKTYYITPPINLPEKGDAFDYFQMGGTVDALTQQASELVIEHKALDAIAIHYPTLQGLLHFSFDAIEKHRHVFETELTITINGSHHDAYSQRINIMSSSARTEMRRDLDALFGKEFGWTAIVNKAFANLREAYAAVDMAVDTSSIEVSHGQELYLVNPLLPFNSPTIMFGDGGSFKTYIAIALSIHTAIGREWMGSGTPCLPIIYVDYEGTIQSFALRQRRLLDGMGIDELPTGILYYWPGRGLPLADHIDALRKKIQEIGACLVVIDSVGPACGGEPEKADVALGYFRSLARLGVTTLSLAHITKQGENKYPFGSVYWHNEARRTWYVERVQEEELPELDIGMYCRKVNDGPRPRPIAISAKFDDPYGQVILSSSNIANIPELADKLPAHNRIWNALTQPMTVKDISEFTNIEEKVVGITLHRHPKLFSQQRASDVGESTGRGRPPQLWARSHRE